MDIVRIALAQINTIVGDLTGNTEKILFCVKQARKEAVELVIFPELTVTGYPPEDLLFKPHFIQENIKCLHKIAKAVKNIIAIVGYVDYSRENIYNSAGVLGNGKVFCAYHKIRLPNYGVFDEKRYFIPGHEGIIVKTKDFSFAVTICEDIWGREKAHAVPKADILVNISASPYYINKIRERKELLTKKARLLNMPIAYCNLIGGQDELVFDGRSMVFSKEGNIIAEAKAFEEDMLIMDLPIDSKQSIKKIKGTLKNIDKDEEVYSALILGVRDYVLKNNFNKVIFGLSGGIDSALVACVSRDALGKANVIALSMPSRYSSKEAQDDAEKIARNLSIRFVKIDIDDMFDSYIKTLRDHFAGMDSDKTEENIQARIRANILMAFSNKFGYLVLNTGNKSETSVGYCTLYGDMAGGFAVIKDVPKGLVYELSGYINRREGKEIIPKSVFERPPSAELKPNQKDQDTLPPYELLDEIIDLYIEKDKPFRYIAKKIGDENRVRDVLKMIDKNEYKRRQASPGIKITQRAFGKDRRMPITNKFATLQISDKIV